MVERHVLRFADRVARASGIDSFVGRPSALWEYQRLHRGGLPSVAEAVDAVRGRLSPDALVTDDAPLFIFSASWRSGSTLLQRLVVSADTHFIWGEPYAQSDVIRRLADSLIPFGTGWPTPKSIYTTEGIGGNGGELHEQWIANLYPEVSRVVEAHRAFLREMLAPPPSHATLGWGLKEVRLSAHYAHYLRLLFPRAKFLFLTRDPRHAYASYRQRPVWFDRWPRSQVRTPYAYGLMWRALAESFLTYEHTLDAVLVRYEDLVEGVEALDRLEALLGAPIDRSILTRRISGPARVRSGGPTPLELLMLDRATHPTAGMLGYAQPRTAMS